MAKDDVVKDFTKIKGVGKAKAELLYDKGFDSLEKLKKAIIEMLSMVKTKKTSVELFEIKGCSHSNPGQYTMLKIANPPKEVVTLVLKKMLCRMLLLIRGNRKMKSEISMPEMNFKNTPSILLRFFNMLFNSLVSCDTTEKRYNKTRNAG